MRNLFASPTLKRTVHAAASRSSEMGRREGHWKGLFAVPIRVSRREKQLISQRSNAGRAICFGTTAISFRPSSSPWMTQRSQRSRLLRCADMAVACSTSLSIEENCFSGAIAMTEALGSSQGGGPLAVGSDPDLTLVRLSETWVDSQVDTVEAVDTSAAHAGVRACACVCENPEKSDLTVPDEPDVRAEAVRCICSLWMWTGRPPWSGGWVKSLQSSRAGPVGHEKNFGAVFRENLFFMRPRWPSRRALGEAKPTWRTGAQLPRKTPRNSGRGG